MVGWLMWLVCDVFCIFYMCVMEVLVFCCVFCFVCSGVFD